MLIQKISRTSPTRSAAKLSRIYRSSMGLLTEKFPKETTRSLSTSPWADFEMAPIDPIVGLNEIFQKDDFPSKVIVGVGSYRDDVSLQLGAIDNQVEPSFSSILNSFLLFSSVGFLYSLESLTFSPV